MQEPIHVALGIHDPTGDYSRHAGAMLASLFLHTKSSVCAHIIHNDTFTAENKANFQSVAHHFGKEIFFYQVQLPEIFHSAGGHVTQGALFRLLLPDLVSATKVIYFDCDVIVNMDIRQLWQIDLQDRPIAAVLDPGIPHFPEITRQRVQNTGIDLQNYFNSGVMVLNLNCLRQNYQLFKQAADYLVRYPDAFFFDQDALNWLFQHNYLQLDSRYNRIVARSGLEEFRQPAVWHFAGVKPWDCYNSPLDILYWKALALTPWQENLLDRLSASICRTMAKIAEQLQKDKFAYETLEKKIATLEATKQFDR